MTELSISDENRTRFAEIQNHLKKLDIEMASPNIKEIKHAELSALYRQLSAEQQSLRQPSG